MKTILLTRSKFLIFFSVFLGSVLIVSAFNSGFTGRTLKTSTSGCGGCHGANATTDVIVAITGPDTAVVGQTVPYSLSVTKPSKTGAGLDIAARSGTLSPVSSTIHLSNGELTHNSNIPMVSGTATVQFNYIAPASPTTDTIFATGLATNSNGNTSGDDWNWAPSKRVIVRDPIGIQNQSMLHNFRLSQNFPNPFNAETFISFELPEKSDVKLTVLDILGNEVSTVLNGSLNRGEYNVKWNADNYGSGIYFYKLVAGAYSGTRKMVLIK